LLLVLVMLIPSSSAAEVTASNKIVAPGQSFDLNVSIKPLGTPIAGAQLDLSFDRSLLRINSITEGPLFKQKGSSTFFNGGIINNYAGTVVNIFDIIIGRSNVTSPGTFIIINMTVIGSSGTMGINLSNMKISDPNGSPVALNVTNGTVLIKGLPVLAPRYDINEDGKVEIGDLVIIGQHFNEVVNIPYPRYDVNMDGVVDIEDVKITSQHFGEQT